MGIIKKQAFQSAIFLYSGVLLGFVNTGLLAPNFLTKSQIGVMNLLLSFAGIFGAFGIMGFNTATVRFFPHFRDKTRNHHGFLFIMTMVGAAGFLVFLMVYYPLKPLIIASNQEKSPLLANFFFLVVPLTFFQIYFALYDMYNNMVYRSSIGMFLREFMQRFLIMITLLFFIFNLVPFDTFIFIYVGAICVQTVFLVLYQMSQKDFNLMPQLNFLDKSLIRGMASMSAFGFLNSFSNFAILRIDTIMVNQFINDAATGVYVTTFYFGALVLLPAKALNKIAPTLISDAYKKDDLATVEDIHKKSTLNLHIIAMLVLLGLAININNVFHIIPNDFKSGNYVIIFIALANVLKMSSGMSDSIIAFSKYYKFTTMFLVILLIMITVFNILFIPIYGITGAAFASFLAILIWCLIKFIFIYKKFGFQPYNKKYVFVIILTLLLYLFISNIPELPHFVPDIIVRSTTAVLLFFIPLYYLRISADINQIIENAAQQVKRIFK